MERNVEKTTLRDTWRIHLRAYRDVRAYCPGLFPATVLFTATKALSPYVSIWLSARILDVSAGTIEVLTAGESMQAVPFRQPL